MSDLAELVAAHLGDVRRRIRDAGGTDAVEILAVTKGHPGEVVDAAIAAGCPMIGENYAQELIAKLSDRDVRPEVHFIGQLQTNKVRSIVHLVDVYESVDRPSLVAELARRAPAARVLIQLGLSGETGKGGCPFSGFPALLDAAIAAGLCVEGLMTVGPTVGGPEAARPIFRRVRQLADEHGLAVCSMGMSDDFEVAVQEGSTRLRLGSALFGPRPPAPAHLR